VSLISQLAVDLGLVGGFGCSKDRGDAGHRFHHVLISSVVMVRRPVSWRSSASAVTPTN
jgi:hypothetical protein